MSWCEGASSAWGTLFLEEPKPFVSKDLSLLTERVTNVHSASLTRAQEAVKKLKTFQEQKRIFYKIVPKKNSASHYRPVEF